MSLSESQLKLLRTLEAQPYAELSPDNKLLLRRMQEKASGLPVNKAAGSGKSILDMIQIGREEGAGQGTPVQSAPPRRAPLSRQCAGCGTETRAKAAVGKNIYRCPNPKCRRVWSSRSATRVEAIEPVPVSPDIDLPLEGAPEYLVSGQKSRIYSGTRGEE